MVRYTLLGIADGVAIILAFKVLGGNIAGIFLLAFFLAAFFGGMMANYGQGVWAGFFSSFFFPLIWATDLLDAKDPNGWLIVVGFFILLGIVTGIVGGLIGILGNVTGNRVFAYNKDL